MAQKYNPNYLFLHENWDRYKFFLLQGGGRSGKTYSIYHFIIWMFNKYPNAGIELDAVRDSFPILRATILKEFIDVLDELGMYREDAHNMSNHRIEINGNFFNYYSVDTEIKARGRKRHILWLNEPNNIKKPIIDQLLIRTIHKVIADFNPSEPVGTAHWLYDDLMVRENAGTITTTYKDNPFLEKSLVEEIELYQTKDPEFYKVFGQGQRAAARKGQIFTHFRRSEDIPYGNYFYGLDFGKSNDPTALIRFMFDDGDLFAEEVIYQTNLTSAEIVAIMKQRGVKPNEPIYADSAEPLMIREIKNAGFNIHGAEKGKGSISGGIDKIKSMNVYLTNGSKNLWTEAQWYCWKLDANEQPINEPIDLHNHGMDAMRYALEHLPKHNFKRKFMTA